MIRWAKELPTNTTPWTQSSTAFQQLFKRYPRRRLLNPRHHAAVFSQSRKLVEGAPHRIGQMHSDVVVIHPESDRLQHVRPAATLKAGAVSGATAIIPASSSARAAVPPARRSTPPPPLPGACRAAARRQWLSPRGVCHRHRAVVERELRTVQSVGWINGSEVLDW
jgi:hypothetical protein